MVGGFIKRAVELFKFRFNILETEIAQQNMPFSGLFETLHLVMALQQYLKSAFLHR